MYLKTLNIYLLFEKMVNISAKINLIKKTVEVIDSAYKYVEERKKKADELYDEVKNTLCFFSMFYRNQRNQADEVNERISE